MVAILCGSGKLVAFLVAALGEQRGKIVQIVQTFAGLQGFAPPVQRGLIGRYLILFRVAPVYAQPFKNSFHRFGIGRQRYPFRNRRFLGMLCGVDKIYFQKVFVHVCAPF